MATLADLMGAITDIQNRGGELVDPAAAMQSAQVALLQQLVTDVAALQSAAPAAAETAAQPNSFTVEMVQELVQQAVSAAFGKLEAAVEQAQPAVAEENNTGSGAAPVAPDAHPASDSAALPPAAAGTAPEQAPAQG